MAVMAASLTDPFHFEPDRPSFEDLASENGSPRWLASDLAVALEYESLVAMNDAIVHALAASALQRTPRDENFEELQDGEDGNWRLSRFACYLIAMNADPN